jgi:hypothetical protein
VNGTFGIAYQPSKLTFSTKSLNSSCEQAIPITKEYNVMGATYNVGVNVGFKDMTHDTKGWTLTAQLQWTGSGITGATINTTSKASINRNTNNRTNNFMSNDLQSVHATEQQERLTYQLTILHKQL